VLIMWGLVSYLHSGDAHAHGTGQEIHHEDKHPEDDHAEGEHAEDDHAHEENE